MMVQEELQKVIKLVKSWQWTPELFDRVRELLGYADVFNVLRRELLPGEYQQFDLEYCSHYRPQDRDLTKWLTEWRKEEEWKKETMRRLRRMNDEELLKASQHIVKRESAQQS